MQPIGSVVSQKDAFLARSVRANRGDLANQAGLLEGLRRSPRIGQVYVSTFYPHHFEGKHDVTPIPPPSLRGYLISAQELGILKAGVPVFWGGGVDLQDTGSKLKMVLLLLRIFLLKMKGSPFVLGFQGAGPVRTAVGGWLLRQICKRIDSIIVREPTGLRLLSEQGGCSNDKLFPSIDSALMLPPPDPAVGSRYLASHSFDPNLPVLGVNVRRWFHQKGGWLPTQFHSHKTDRDSEVSIEQLLQVIAKAIAQSARFRQVLLLPMYRREPEVWEDDILLLERLRALLPNSYHVRTVEEDLSPYDLLSLFSQLSLVIGVRLHSTIMAQVAGVPAIHIAYEHKGVDFYRAMGLPELLFPIDEAVSSPNADRTLEKLILSTCDRTEALKQVIATRVSSYRTEAQAVLEHVVDRTLRENDD